MPTLLLTVLLALAPPGPDAQFTLAAADLAALPPADRAYARYLSLGPIPAADREHYREALAFWCNSLSFRKPLATLRPVADGALLRLDLRDFAWDREARYERLARLEQLGVRFDLKDAQAREEFVDVWELLAHRDPYFKVDQDLHGVHHRGWIDPEVERAARALSYSCLFVLRGDWFLAQTSTDRPLGRYSDVLMLPDTEAALFKQWIVDEKRLDEERAKQGGASLSLAVALHNRELQLLPAGIGGDQKFLWRSLDVNSDLDDRSVLERFAGTVKPDGKEYIFSLPNGLHGYYVANGQGKQVAEVPPNIAQDHADEHDARVLNAYKCVKCHSVEDGIRTFKDAVTGGAKARDVGLAVVGDPRDPKATRLRRDVEDYYLGLQRATSAHQASYVAAVEEASGLKPDANAVNYVSRYDDYTWGRVDKARAAREFGVDPEAIDGLLFASGDPQLLTILRGQPISRESFERAYHRGLQHRAYRWDRQAARLPKEPPDASPRRPVPGPDPGNPDPRQPGPPRPR